VHIIAGGNGTKAINNVTTAVNGTAVAGVSATIATTPAASTVVTNWPTVETVKLVMAGTVASYTSAVLDSVKADIASSSGCTPADVSLTVAAGSVVITATMPNSAASTLTSKISSGAVTSLGGHAVESATLKVTVSVNTTVIRATSLGSNNATNATNASKPEIPTNAPTNVPTLTPTETPTVHKPLLIAMGQPSSNVSSNATSIANTTANSGTTSVQAAATTSGANRVAVAAAAAAAGAAIVLKPATTAAASAVSVSTDGTTVGTGSTAAAGAAGADSTAGTTSAVATNVVVGATTNAPTAGKQWFVNVDGINVLPHDQTEGHGKVLRFFRDLF
jgi:hypothetical protein